MSDKEKIASDSGIEVSRKSKSGSGGSLTGVEQSSFNDFDDSGHGSRRGTYDDDYDDDYVDDDEKPKVDLDAFLGNVPAGDDVGDEDGEDEEEEGSEEGDEEDEDEDEDEGEYETEEDEAGANEIGPGDVVTNVEASYQQLLEEQLEQNKKVIKDKKKDLINEYLHDVRHFNHLRTKNVLLGLKIITHIDQKQAVIDKYVQRELDEQERLKEAERLKRLHFLESCAVFQQGKKKFKGRKKSKQKRASKSKKKNKQKQVRTRFSSAGGQQSPSPAASSSDPDQVKSSKRKFYLSTESHEIPDVSLNALGKEFLYNLESIKQKKGSSTLSDIRIANKKACKRQKYIRERISRKLRRFSFMRSQFFKDVPKPKPKKARHTRHDLMDLNLKKLHSKNKEGTDSKAQASSTSLLEVLAKAKKPSTNQKMRGLSYGSKSRRRFNVTKEALDFSKSKSRMALDHHKQEQKIQLYSDSTNYKDLHHFKFEFADPRLTAKQASVKLREELIKLLHQRHIPTTQLKWPLEVKGVDFEGKNPYGRVCLNYTRLSHHEKELPHTAYRILLTNMTFLRTKEQRMTKEHRKNMVELENECASLKKGVYHLFKEIVEGLRIITSLCGVTDFEKKEARRATESFIQELEKYYEEFLTEMLIKLYKCISTCEFALRRLWISEGKGEGAELHEFKDIMRCREKLKAEHRTVERTISKYQRHSINVLKTVRNSGKRLMDTIESTGKMKDELDHMKKAVGTVIEGMYHCQEVVQTHLATEVQLKNETGILSSPVLTEDYKRLLEKIDDTKIKRLDLQRQYNGKVREIEKIMKPSSRFVRYKLRS